MNKINSARTNEELLTQYQVEVVDAASFRFRLVHLESGRASGWAGYTSIAMLDDVAACTSYYSGNAQDELTPMPAADLLRMFSVGEYKPKRKTFLEAMTEALGDEFTLIQGEFDHEGSFIVINKELTPATLYRAIRLSEIPYFTLPKGKSKRMCDVVAMKRINFLFNPCPADVSSHGMIEIDPADAQQVQFDVTLNRFYVTAPDQVVEPEVPVVERTARSVIEAGLNISLVADKERGLSGMALAGERTELPTVEEITQFIERNPHTSWQGDTPDCGNDDGHLYFQIECLEGSDGLTYVDQVAFDSNSYTFVL